MESCTNARAAQLIRKLNTALEALSARVEGAVSAQLDVRLEPVSLRMAMPSAEQFHGDLTQLIEKGKRGVGKGNVGILLLVSYLYLLVMFMLVAP